MADKNIYYGTITRKSIDKVINAIIPMEEKCVNLLSLLNRQKAYFEENQYGRAFVDAIVFYSEENQQGEVLGVMLTSRRGVVLHCFFEKISEELEAMICDYFLNTMHPTSIMGDLENSEIIEKIIFNALSKKAIHNDDYKLMSLSQEDKSEILNRHFYQTACMNLNTNLKTLIPPLSDVDKLLGIELDYQREEVLINDRKIDENFFRALLEKYIRRSCLYTIKMSDKYLAKATISAVGVNCLQIGGVYTVPRHRNKGLGAALLQALIGDSRNNNKTFVLFVKSKNMPARNMYKKLGFKNYCDFRITYF